VYKGLGWPIFHVGKLSLYILNSTCRDIVICRV